MIRVWSDLSARGPEESNWTLRSDRCSKAHPETDRMPPRPHPDAECDQSPTCRAPNVFLFLRSCRRSREITHWNCFRAALDSLGSFSSLVLVNWDRLTRRLRASVLAIPPRKWAGRIHRGLEQQSLETFSECDWVTVMDWK